MNNHVLMVMGRATDQAQELESKAGKKFSKFSVAVNDFRGEKTGRVTQFYDVVCFNRQSLGNAKLIHKGDPVLVYGRPEVQAYESKSGELKAKLGVNAQYVTLFGLPKHLREQEETVIENEEAADI